MVPWCRLVMVPWCRLVDFGQLMEELPDWEGEVAVEVLVEHVRAQVQLLVVVEHTWSQVLVRPSLQGFPEEEVLENLVILQARKCTARGDCAGLRRVAGLVERLGRAGVQVGGVGPDLEVLNRITDAEVRQSAPALGCAKGLFTYDVSQKWGGPDPPSPPCQPKSEFA